MNSSNSGRHSLLKTFLYCSLNFSWVESLIHYALPITLRLLINRGEVYVNFQEVNIDGG